MLLKQQIFKMRETNVKAKKFQSQIIKFQNLRLQKKKISISKTFIKMLKHPCLMLMKVLLRFSILIQAFKVKHDILLNFKVQEMLLFV